MKNFRIIQHFVEKMNNHVSCPACDSGFDLSLEDFWIPEDEPKKIFWDGKKRRLKKTHNRPRVKQPNTGILDFKYVACANEACDEEWGYLCVAFMDADKDVVFHARNEAQIDRNDNPLSDSIEG